MGCCGGKPGCKKTVETNKLAMDSSMFEIKFGPDNAYSLLIPVSHHVARGELAEQLRAAADGLDYGIKCGASLSSQQKVLPFLK
jgi:hypothetical protein